MERKINGRQVGLLHFARASVGMTEEEYRGMLGSLGVASSTELTQEGLDECMTRLEAAGFRRDEQARATAEGYRAVRGTAAKSGMDRRVPEERERMLSKMEAILAELGLGWAYADGMARRMFRVERVRFCGAEQVHRLVQALTVHQRRTASRAGTGRTEVGR